MFSFSHMICGWWVYASVLSYVGEGGIEIGEYKSCIVWESGVFLLPLVSSSCASSDQKSVRSFDWNINKVWCWGLLWLAPWFNGSPRLTMQNGAALWTNCQASCKDSLEDMDSREKRGHCENARREIVLCDMRISKMGRIHFEYLLFIYCYEFGNSFSIIPQVFIF